ncbi:hypothetical protein QTO34_005330 [Cnephaeus nilssonii]|uniref:Uncharacterized protein n=1 Tax=Cnephaeus nilssonii TaxID=3371016 RepID=A0AA40HP98_CNENI|nr:hypothetical protein QTO34_005330 [Eptesicus nilssonii]
MQEVVLGPYSPGRKAFGKCSQPLRHLGALSQAGPRRQHQGWACCDLAPGVAARSGDHGTTYSLSCCSRQAQETPSGVDHSSQKPGQTQESVTEVGAVPCRAPHGLEGARPRTPHQYLLRRPQGPCWKSHHEPRFGWEAKASSCTQVAQCASCHAEPWKRR